MERKRDSTVEERRPAVRVPVDFAAKYGKTGMPLRFEARVIEISASGLRLRTSERLSIGMSVDVAFGLDDPLRRSGTTVRLSARVVRFVLEKNSQFEHALAVVDDDGVKNLLRRAVLQINLSAAPEIRRY